MATLSELCASMPTLFVEREEHRTRMEELGLSRKLAWKEERKANHERLMAYRKREERRVMRRGERGESFEGNRNKVRRETMLPIERPETTADIFHAGKGVRQPKKARNKVCSERAGTIRPHIEVKRFEGSRLTCVCKSKRMFA